MSLSVSVTNIANDTFAFGPWIMGKTDGPDLCEIQFKDLELINKEVLDGKGADICKVSFNILPDILEEYQVITSGAAIVKNAGPKIVSKKENPDYSNCSLSVPGKNTTAYLLACGLLPKFKEVSESVYNEIIPSVSSGKSDCGLLIHESGFQIKEKGLHEVANLYKLWFAHTGGLPLPLGGIVVKRSLGEEKINEIASALGNSISYAKSNYDEILPYMQELSPTKDLEVIKKSVNFWVNNETRSLSSEGKEAIKALMQMSLRVSNKDLKEKNKQIFNS